MGDFRDRNPVAKLPIVKESPYEFFECTDHNSERVIFRIDAIISIHIPDDTRVALVGLHHSFYVKIPAQYAANLIDCLRYNSLYHNGTRHFRCRKPVVDPPAKG